MWMAKNNMNENNLVILEHERFAAQFYYNSDTNIMGENLFKKFNLPQYAVMRRELAEKLYSLVPVLEHFRLKILLKDVLRFYEVQQYLYGHWKEKTGQEPGESLAKVENSPHARGIAFDCVLTDENGAVIPLPSSSIQINTEQRKPDYEFENTPEEKRKERNRNFLRHLMLCAGISPINKEWFHFQLPNMHRYPLFSAENVQNAVLLPYDETKMQFSYYDIFHEYQNDVFEGKTSFWIDNEQYFNQFEKIGVQEFIRKLAGVLE